jgi:hypothetical protein
MFRHIHGDLRRLTYMERLIAIMLGRLEMDVNECITAFSSLMASIFSETKSRLRVGLKGNIKAQFSSQALKDAMISVIEAKGYEPSEPFNDGKPRGCKV